jgi:hypothetical protein
MPRKPAETVGQRLHRELTADGVTDEARIRELERELAEACKAIRLLSKLVDALEARAAYAHILTPKYLVDLRARVGPLREKYRLPK